MIRTTTSLVVTTALVLTLEAARLNAQAQQPTTAARSAKAEAPVDLTVNWVSIITEDWRWRMVTPAKGDYASVPINLAAKNVADTWDPAKDEAAGEQCRSYGAPAIMRIPERVHITWQDDQTLKVETDAGLQTRLFHFGDWKPSTNVAATWQGDSVAVWEIAGGAGARGAGRGARGSGAGSAETPRFGSLKVITSRKKLMVLNGIPSPVPRAGETTFRSDKHESPLVLPSARCNLSGR